MSEHNQLSPKKQTDLFDFHPQTEPDKENRADRSDGDTLLCPHCGDVHLHQRNPEVTPGGGTIRIRFFCEGCHGRATLQIAQHEGHTYVRWFR